MRQLQIADFGLLIEGPAVFIAALVLGLLAAPLGAEAQEPGKAYRIGTLTTSAPTAPESGPNYASFVLGLRELGYVDGQNLVIDHQQPDGVDGGYRGVGNIEAAMPRVCDHGFAICAPGHYRMDWQLETPWLEDR